MLLNTINSFRTVVLFYVLQIKTILCSALTNALQKMLFVFAFETASAQISVDSLQITGPETERINILFMSEGYTEQELPRFTMDAKKVMGDFFAASPSTRTTSMYMLSKLPPRSRGPIIPTRIFTVTLISMFNALITILSSGPKKVSF
jgi:hypothetical protein